MKTMIEKFGRENSALATKSLLAGKFLIIGIFSIFAACLFACTHSPSKNVPYKLVRVDEAKFLCQNEVSEAGLNPGQEPGPCRDLSRVNFSGRDLQGVDFSGSILTGANFTGANLQKANLSKAILDRAIFDKADLTGAQFAKTRVVYGSFVETKMPHLYDVEFYRSDLRSSYFGGENCSVNSVSFVLTDTHGISFENCNWINRVKFVGNMNVPYDDKSPALKIKNSVIASIAFIDSRFPNAEIRGIKTKCPYDEKMGQACNEKYVQIVANSPTFADLNIDKASQKALRLPPAAVSKNKKQ